MKHKRAIIWLKNDLRLHDNEALNTACQEASEVIPVYCFDPRQFRMLELGIQKTGSFRANFLIEAVDNLRTNLVQLGGNLIVRIGKPEEVLPKLSEEFQVDAIYFTEEVTAEEKRIEENLESAVWKQGIETNSYWQSTLFHMEDLPFPVSQTPEVFTHFRKECEKYSEVRHTFDKPNHINFPEIDIDLGELPDLSTLGVLEPADCKKSVLNFQGGEDAGTQRLKTYFWENDCLKDYKETRNGLLGPDYSSKFSAWLALGCLSPRYVYDEVLRYEKERKKNNSTYWMIFELIWRDYFRFISKKHGNKIFQLQGIKNHVDNWQRDETIFREWTEGRTGVPFVDANMRELNTTGFMSNRGRQIVASFLVNDLAIDWRWGAMYFESQLIDYDVCSNWGNWMYVAGVGNDPRENRYFNILKQAKNYDKNGDYVRHWIPELARIPGFEIHHPGELSTKELKKYGITLGRNYPSPIIEFSIQ